MKIVDAVKQFLEKNSPKMCHLYNENMEMQISVSQGDGVPDSGIYQGKSWSGFKREVDGKVVEQWKSIRIPYNANQEPTYDLDKELKFSTDHFNGIGLSGFDWKNQVSKWVVYDFDALVGHSDKNPNLLTDEKLKEIQDKLMKVDWVTIRRSTSGNGLHIYVFVDNIPAKNHTEHASLAKAIIDKMSLACGGYDFRAHVDVFGFLFWVWHEKMKGDKPFELLKEGRILEKHEIPPNWLENKDVITGEFKKSKAYPLLGRRPDLDKAFDELTGKNKKIPLDDGHNLLIKYLESRQDNYWYWSADFHMLVSHTKVLEQAYISLKMKGMFETVSEGSNLASPNCFCFPLSKGAWSVIRYGQGTKEKSLWTHTDGGFTRCYLNREASFINICEYYKAVQDPNGDSYHFPDSSVATKVLRALGENVIVPEILHGRKFKLAVVRKNGNKVMIAIEGEKTDPKSLPDWILKTRPSYWVRLTNINAPAKETISGEMFDSRVRHIVMEGRSVGWRVLNGDNMWVWHDKSNVKDVSKHVFDIPISEYEMSSLLGGAMQYPWTEVNHPFKSEYVGGREWNFNAAQLLHTPTNKPLGELKTPTWDKIFSHLGKALTEEVKKNAWCRKNSIVTGGDYLKCWVTSMIRFPHKKIPYLFFFGKQDSGKSTFHEVVSSLFSKGAISGKEALSSGGSFNGELRSSIFVYVEEKDFSKDQQAYARLKEWTTGEYMSIHAKGCTPFKTQNMTHWCQFGNNHNYVPIAEDDTRVVVISVSSLLPNEIIAPHKLKKLLREEAPDFLAQIFQMEYPEVGNDRMNLPVLSTKEKRALVQTTSNQLRIFLNGRTKECLGATMTLSEFFTKFQEWLDSSDRGKWNTDRVSKEMPLNHPQGLLHGGDGAIHIGNIAWKENNYASKQELTNQDGYLEC